MVTVCKCFEKFTDMKRPYYNLNDRMIIRLNVTESNLMLLKIAWLKLCRELERSLRRSKFF